MSLDGVGVVIAAAAPVMTAGMSIFAQSAADVPSVAGAIGDWAPESERKAIGSIA
jgi:hypothetical protein